MDAYTSKYLYPASYLKKYEIILLHKKIPPENRRYFK